MSRYCRHCGMNDFRPSRFQSSDFWQLLRLHLPLRCRTCHERTYVPMSEYRALQRSQHYAQPVGRH